MGTGSRAAAVGDPRRGIIVDGIISTRTYVLIEAVFSFGGVIVFCLYQLWSVRRAIARREARERDGAACVSPDATHSC